MLLNGWEEKPSMVNEGIAFDHVARAIYDFDGIEGSIPSNLVAGEEYTGSYSFELPSTILNYNNAIKDARLQNNSKLAEIAYQSLQAQLQLSLEGFQYKNQLVLEQANKKVEMDNMYWGRYQDVLNQINTENALNEQIRQFNQNYNLQLEELAAARAAAAAAAARSNYVSSTPTYTPSSGTMSLPMAAAQVAKQYSVEDAVDWINSQPNVSQAEKNAAIQNAKGVAQTEYYRKQAEALAKNKK